MHVAAPPQLARAPAATTAVASGDASRRRWAPAVYAHSDPHHKGLRHLALHDPRQERRAARPRPRRPVGLVGVPAIARQDPVHVQRVRGRQPEPPGRVRLRGHRPAAAPAPRTPYNPASGQCGSGDLTAAPLSVNATDGRTPLFPVSFPAYATCTRPTGSSPRAPRAWRACRGRRCRCRPRSRPG
jgi:hypothetical protein